VGNPVSLKS